MALGCNREKPAPPAPPPAPVTVAQPIRRQIIDWDEYTGRLEAVEFVEVRPRVGGYITQAPINEGAVVKTGDPLYVIDPEPYQARVHQAEADVAKFQAQLEYNTNELNRIAPLRKQGVASEKEYNDDILNQKTAAAALEGAKAALKQAQLDLDWTQVTAPIDGRVGRKLVTPGNLVNGGVGQQATLLTTIASVRPIDCYVDADEQSVLRYRRMVQQGKIPSVRAGATIPCYLGLADETGYPREGAIDFVNNRLDPLTGTLQIRGRFMNGDGALAPGYFARLRIPASPPYEALLVADGAIGTDQSQRFVLVVGPDNKVQYHRVDVGKLVDGLRVINSGVGPDDWIVINGLLKARPNTVVNPTRAPMPVPQPPTTIPASANGGTTMPSSATAPSTAPAATRPSS